jgi:tetratricopeptide (TPR) repeat protein
MRNISIERKYVKVFVGVTLTVAIAGSLPLLEHRKSSDESRPAPPPSASSTAAEHIHELTALQEQLKQNPNHAPILFRMALLSSEMGKTDDAISYLRQLLKTNASNSEASLELGRLLYANQDIAGAVAETEKILRTDPTQVDALYNLGAINANLGKEAVARDYWKRAVASAPDSESGKRAKDGLLKLGPAVVQAHNAGSAPHQ